MDSVPFLELGVPPGPPLFRVRRARLLSDGRVVVANAGSRELLVFGPSGEYEATIGRPGEGPDEFRTLRDLYVCRGDTLVVNDFRQVSYFTSGGAFVKSVSLSGDDPGVTPFASGIAADCSSLFVRRVAHPELDIELNEVGEETATLAWGTFNPPAIAPVATIETREMWHRWRGFVIPVPWGKIARGAAAGSRVFASVSDRPEVRVYERDRGLVLIARWRERPKPVTARDRKLLGQERERLLPGFPPLADVLPPLDEFPRLPEEKPLFLTLLADDEGRLWVREYPDFVAGAPLILDVWGDLGHQPPPDGARDVWKVFGPDDRFDGVLRVPATRHILAIERGRALTLEGGENDVELVRIYRIRRAGGEP